jgi:hypothetical protein
LVLSSKISSLRVFMWVSLSSLVTFIIVLLRSGTGYSFSSFSTESCVELFFFEESGFHPFFFPSLHLVLCNYVFDRLVGGFNCLISFPDLILLL